MVNLWDSLVWEAGSYPVGYKRIKLEEELEHLAATSQTGQEISLGAEDDGWVVKIHSCCSDMEVVIRVPRDPKVPVEIVKDTRGGQ